MESRRVLKRYGYVTRYDYDLTRYADGKVYSRHISEATDLPEEGALDVWASPDNREFRTSTSEDIKKSSQGDLLVAGLALIVGIFLWNGYKKKETGKARKERIESTRFYAIMVFVLSLIGGGVCGIAACSDYKIRGYWDFFDSYFMGTCAVIAVISMIVYFVYRKKKI